MMPNDQAHQDVQIFNKYKESGAYHWKQMKPSLKRFNAGLAARYEVALELLPPPEDIRTILDIGCGDGYFSSRLAQQFKSAQIFAYDFDETGIELAKRQPVSLELGNLHFNVGDAFYGHKDVSLIVATDVIEHVSDASAFLRKCFDTLRPSGYLLLSTPIRYKEFPDDKYHIREFFFTEFEKLTESSGFNILEHVATHDFIYVEKYGWRYSFFGVGKMRLMKYFYNALSMYLDKNPFKNRQGNLPTMQYLLARRRG